MCGCKKLSVPVEEIPTSRAVCHGSGVNRHWRLGSKNLMSRRKLERVLEDNSDIAYFNYVQMKLTFRGDNKIKKKERSVSNKHLAHFLINRGHL